MRVLCCGDRNYGHETGDWTMIYYELSKFPLGAVVIHGDCRGADKMCGRTAKELGFTVQAYPADWKTHGHAAGPIRNRQMLSEGKPDLVLAFHRNLEASRGTKDMVRAAKEAGVEVRVIVE